MARAEDMDVEGLREAFEYIDGQLYYKQHSYKSLIGRPAGRKSSDGYKVVKYNKHEHKVHRIIYALHYGYLPGNLMIDHIDGDKLNNCIDNLRAVTYESNTANAVKNNKFTSIYKGVCWDRRRYKWRATVTANGRRFDLGRFNTAEEAAYEYDKKVRELKPGVATTNFPIVGERSALTGDMYYESTVNAVTKD